MSVETQLFILRSVHTAIFVIEVAAILYMIWRGLRGPLDRWCGYAVLLTAGTGLALVLNGGECIFQTWAEQISGQEIVSDIYVPVAVARLIVPVSLPFVALGYVLLAWRWFKDRRRLSR